VGESLLEVIVALFVVAVGSGTATSLIVSALQANTFGRDNLVALNLAVEGLEAMRNVRDTNWLKLGYDKGNCWNVLPGLAAGTDCTLPTSKIAEGFYTIDLNPINYSWGLTQVGTALDLSNNMLATNDNYKLGYADVNNTVLNEKDVFVTDTAIPPLPSPPITYGGESKFYRMIQITYDTGDPGAAESMDVVSTVQWEQNGVHAVRLSTTLANYEKVPL